MRIIAGEFRGRRLASVRGRLRPTSDLVREAVFNILGPAVAGARVLDLFAGTGALALEALSRGAARAVVVEDQAAALEVLRKNIEALKVADRVTVLSLPVFIAVKKLALRREPFHIIFLDPPYERGFAAETLRTLAASGLPAPGAWVVAEHSRREELPDHPGSLRLHQRRRYGDTVVSFYQEEEPTPLEEERH